MIIKFKQKDNDKPLYFNTEDYDHVSMLAKEIIEDNDLFNHLIKDYPNVFTSALEKIYALEEVNERSS